MTTKIKDDDTQVFGGFDAMFESLTSQEPGVRDRGDNMIDNYDPDPDNDDEEEDQVDETIIEKDEDDDEVIEENEDLDIEEDDNIQTDKDDNVSTDDDEVSLIEPFVELFSKELGWELGDEDKPKSVKELVDYMSEIIEVNSQPVYASQEIAELDDYVKAGGDVKSFFEKVYSNPSIDEYNIENKDHQVAVVKELLKIKGFSDARVEKTIERYEDAGVLQEEAEDALEIVNEHREELKKRLLVDQKKQHEEYTKRQQNYIASVGKTIESIDSVKGIPVSKKDRLQLRDYIFKVGPDGKTDFQRDYSSDTKFLIESAFFTMKKDEDLTQKLKSKAQSSAVTEFKRKLKNTTKRNRDDATRDVSYDKNDMISAISRHLIQPK